MSKQNKRPIDPSLEALFGASDALNVAATQIHCVLVAINAGDKKVDKCALLTHVHESLTVWRDTANKVEDVLHGMQQLPDDAAGGYEAARDWFSDCASRIEEADGYEVPSRLRDHFDALPFDRQGPFLDAVGAFHVTECVVGEPYIDKYDFAESIAFQALSGPEQDAQAAILWPCEEAGDAPSKDAHYD
jgi:hypothetical protein